MQHVSCLHQRKMVELLSFTFTMSNYSYTLLSRCDKQLGSYLVLLHETIAGLTMMATEHCLLTIINICGKTSSHCVVYKFYKRLLIENQLYRMRRNFVVSIGLSYLIMKSLITFILFNNRLRNRRELLRQLKN